MRILLVESRFYDDIANNLLKGAKNFLNQQKIKFDVISVSGALEIPAAINFAAQSGKYDGFVALGCVVRGETYHFEVVCNESARGLMDLSINKNLCIGNGILTTNNMKQAKIRASVSGENKGEAAAKACIELIKIKKKFSKK